jgi:CDP-6-deoxy-D-xylo-4-hexulose-3-dehydrase
VAIVNSGSTANLNAVMALMSPLFDNPLRPGDEVITHAVTFPTTLAPIVHGGLIPVFVDCELGTSQRESGVARTRSRPRRGHHGALRWAIPLTSNGTCARRNLYLIEDTCDARRHVAQQAGGHFRRSAR